jgi:hypothetical protein
MRDLAKRLAALEKVIKSSAESPIWIDGKNNVIRVDVGHKRGEPIEFPTVYDARIWLEKQIDAHAGGLMGYGVDNVADLCEHAPALKAALKEIIPNGIFVPDMQTHLEKGEFVFRDKEGPANHPVTYDADNNLPGDLAFVGIPGGAADLRLWCLASLITHYTWRLEFRERWEKFELTSNDFRMYLAMLVIYVWDRPGSKEQLNSEFYRLFHQVTKLPSSFEANLASD